MPSLSTDTKRKLAKVYALQFLQGRHDLSGLASELGIDEKEMLREFDALKEEGLVELQDGVPKLTARGRSLIVVVMTGGAFDIIHPGHLETLERAKSLGDVLIVSVARNKTFEKNKRRKPLHDEKLRARLVLSLKPVDAAVLGSESDIFETVGLLLPDVIALGYDQSHAEVAIQSELEKRGIKSKVVRLASSVPEIKTSKLVNNNAESLRDI